MTLLTLTKLERSQYSGVIAFVQMLLEDQPCPCTAAFGQRYAGKHLAISIRGIRNLYEATHPDDGESRANKRIFKLALREVQYGKQMYVPIGHNN